MHRKVELLLAARPCGQCLTTRNRIVSGARAAEIIRECRSEQTHFICHKSPEGTIIHCRGVHDRFCSGAFKMASRLGIPIVEVDVDLIQTEGN